MGTHKSNCEVLFICTKEFGWNWDGFQLLRKHFKNVNLITWDGDEEELEAIGNKIKNMSYDYLISFWSLYFISPNEFEAAKKGAINIHPAPVDHPGMGMFSYIFAFPDKRMYHGTTVHEINEKLDNGPVYRSSKFPVYGMSPYEVLRCSIQDSLKMFEEVLIKLKKGCSTTELKDKSKDLNWSPHFFTHKQELKWLSELPTYHIAHKAESFTVAKTVNEMYFKHNLNCFNEYQSQFTKNKNLEELV